MKAVVWLVTATCCAILVPSAWSAEPSRREVAAAAATFRKTCLHCHQGPDLRFSTDRAWFDQLHRTA